MEKNDILSCVSAVVDSAVGPEAAAVDADGRFPTAAIAALRDQGLLGLVSAPEVGGLGADLGTAARAVELLATACGSTALIACMHGCAAAVIEAHGGVEARRAATRELATLAFSEAGS